jgi:predicted GNAT family acetyltransferase
MSSGNDADLFWSYYGGGTLRPRVSCTELLFEVAFPFPVLDCKWNIRPAAHHELEEIADAHAAIAFMESGVDPMVSGRAGFLSRTARRIEQGRTFVVYDGETLVFKADIVAETADVVYLEGIYVAPHYRGTGVGSSCLSALTLHLLKKAKTVCLLSNINFIEAHLSYFKAGFRNTDSCTTLFA